MLLENAAEVLTCNSKNGNDIGRVVKGAVAIAGEHIVAVGTTSEVHEAVDVTSANVVNASGKVVAPGFVDCHTHLIFGGSRAKEYAARMTHSAAEVAAMDIPSGIPATVQMTRNEDENSLTDSALDRLYRMLRDGTTTVESKSGYGLSVDQEIKMLKVNQRLQNSQPIDIVSTFLGAHDFSPDMPRNDYIENVIHEQIPAVAEQKLARYCDIYCDDGYYTVDETRRILVAGLNAGLKPKMHTDAYANIGGSELAAELGVVTADHLNYCTQDQMAQLAKAGVVGVIMPALDFAVGHDKPFNARMMIDEGMTLALATDLCPGCWSESMQFVMTLACKLYQMSPEEALLASTLGAAKALELDSDRGSLVPGKLADIQIWNIPTFEDVIYRLGNNAVVSVIKRGKICF